MIKKVYFPRLAIPIAGVMGGFIDFGLAFLVLLGMMLAYGFMPTLNILWTPLLFLLAVVTSLGVGVWLAAVNVQYRDIRYIAPFLMQIWMFATPIVYPGNLLPEPWATLYGLNPMAGVVEGFRWALLGSEKPGGIVLVSALAAAALLVSGLYYFRRMEKSFSDVV